MKYTIHENGWTVILDPEFQFSNATQEDINEIARLLSKQTLVVARGQTMTWQDEVRVAKMWHDVQQFPPNQFHVDGSEQIIMRVTGKKDELGNTTGLFGHVTDLDWHCNNSANPERHPVVWLLGIKGVEGSRTSWLNHKLAYDDLSNEDKEYFKTIKMINGYKTAQYGGYSPDHFGKEIDINYNYTPDLVVTTHAGVTGLFFPFLQIHQIVGMDDSQSKEFVSKLRAHCEQEKYMYHLDWQVGDVTIADQWLGVHKRWKFEDIANRELHRMVMRYPLIDYS